MKPIVYGLFDADVSPICIRYIGKTIRPLSVRVSQHVYDATRRLARNHRATWIRSVVEKGHRLSALILGSAGSREELDVLERHYVAVYGGHGWHDITNGTEGGDGCSAFAGRKHTPEARAKISAALKGQRFTPERRARIKAARQRQVMSPEHIAKCQAGRRGSRNSPAHNAKISAANYRRWADRKDQAT